MTAKHYYVLMAGSSEPWILQLEPSTPADCRRAIAWQHHGGNDELMLIVRWDADSHAFVDSVGHPHKAHRVCRTVESWNGFLASLPGMERRFARASSRQKGAIGAYEDKIFECVIPLTGGYGATMDGLAAAINEQGYEVRHVYEHSARRDCL